MRTSLFLRGIAAAGVLSTCLFANQADAAESAALQVPNENAAYFDATTHQIRVQLVKPTGVGNHPLAGTKVTVVGTSGKISQAVADDTGMALLTVDEPGWYGVTVSSKGAHASIPVVVREMPTDALPSPQLASPQSDAGLVKVPMMDLPRSEVLRINRSYLPAPSAESSPVADGPISDTVSTSSQSHYRFALGKDGAVTGQVASISSSGLVQGGAGNNVLIYSEGKLVARTVTDDLGQFSVADLTPGIHGIVVAGPSGYSAFAFEAVEASSMTSQRSSSEYTLVSTTAAVQQPGPPVMVPVLPPSMVVDVPSDDDGAGFIAPDGSPVAGPVGGVGGAPMGGVGGGLGGGIGGGVGGGLGAGGGLLGLAAVGGVAAVAIAANDNNNVTPPVNTNGQQ